MKVKLICLCVCAHCTGKNWRTTAAKNHSPQIILSVVSPEISRLHEFFMPHILWHEPHKMIFDPVFTYLSTLKPRYNESGYSEFCDIVNKTQLPYWGFTKHITFDIYYIVNYSIKWTKRFWRNWSLYQGLSVFIPKSHIFLKQ